MSELQLEDFDLYDEGFGSANPYYDPEKCNLEIIAQIELSEPSYSYDTRVVWFSKLTKQFYTAHDSGCSCPTPFEEFRKLSDLTPLDKQTLQEIKQELRASDYVTPAQAMEFMEKIRNEWRERIGGKGF